MPFGPSLAGILLASGFVFVAFTKDLSAQPNTPYGRAVKLAAEGKSSSVDVELSKARDWKRKVDISATVFIASDKLASSIGEDVRKYVFPGPNDPGASRVNVRLSPGEEPKYSLQVTPRSEEQIALLNDAIRRSNQGALASLFGMRVAEMQQVHIRLVPDRKFPLIGQGGQPETELVRERGEMVKKAKLVERDVTISIRPVASDNASEVWLRFFDDQQAFDPYPPTALTQSVGWSFPGNRKIWLGPPEYELSAAKPPVLDCVKAPGNGQMMISGIMAIGGEEVRQGVPILDMIPVVGEAVFSSQSTVHYKISVYILLDVQLAR